MNRIRFTFWAIVAVAIGATGMLSSSIAEPASPVTGLKVGIGGAADIISVGLALRILLVVSRRTETGGKHGERDVGW